MTVSSCHPTRTDRPHPAGDDGLQPRRRAPRTGAGGRAADDHASPTRRSPFGCGRRATSPWHGGRLRADAFVDLCARFGADGGQIDIAQSPAGADQLTAREAGGRSRWAGTRGVDGCAEPRDAGGYAERGERSRTRGDARAGGAALRSPLRELRDRGGVDGLRRRNGARPCRGCDPSSSGTASRSASRTTRTGRAGTRRAAALDRQRVGRRLRGLRKQRRPARGSGRDHRTLAPFAVTTHLKDMAVRRTADGFELSEVPLGQGMLPLARYVAAVRRARPEARFCLEMMTRDPLPVPYLTDGGTGWASRRRRAGRSGCASSSRACCRRRGPVRCRASRGLRRRRRSRRKTTTCARAYPCPRRTEPARWRVGAAPRAVPP